MNHNYYYTKQFVLADTQAFLGYSNLPSRNASSDQITPLSFMLHDIIYIIY